MTNISWAARGILHWCLEQPESPEGFSTEDMIAQTPDGRTRVRSVVGELLQKGYLHHRTVLLNNIPVKRLFIAPGEPDTRLRNHGVYLLRRKDGLVKIGCSGSFRNRLRALTNLHGELEQVGFIPCTRCSPQNLERTIHTNYARNRVESEWFDLQQIDIDFILNDYDQS